MLILFFCMYSINLSSYCNILKNYINFTFCVYISFMSEISDFFTLCKQNFKKFKVDIKLILGQIRINEIN